MKIVVIFSPSRRGVDDLGHADRGQVAISLIGEDDLVGVHALDARGHGRGAAVGRLDSIHLEVVIGEDGAADGRDEDRLLANPELVDDLGHQPVGDAVGAAGAVVCMNIGQRLRPLVDELFRRRHG